MTAGRGVPWAELHVGYIHDIYMALVRRELQPKSNWIGEFLPRAATIILADPDRYGDPERALAWDEESGWRFGIFVQGDARSPTVLKSQEYIGDDVLPDPAHVADLAKMLLERRQPSSWWPWSRPHKPWGYPPMYRSYRDLDDGLDDRLRGLLPP